MFMRTWAYHGFPIGSVLTLLGQIFDQKNGHFFERTFFFGFFDKSADSADINEKMLGKVVFDYF